MGSFFAVQAGGGRYPDQASPATSRAAAQFLSSHLHLPAGALAAAERQSVAETVRCLTAVQVRAMVGERVSCWPAGMDLARRQ
jgi:hypothetical protein